MSVNLLTGFWFPSIVHCLKTGTVELLYTGLFNLVVVKHMPVL